MEPIGFSPRAIAIHRSINRTAAAYPCQASIAELFEHCAERFADATAVIHRDRSLSYREVNRAANGLALRLREAGVAAGDAVGVCIARSPELVITLIAIVKCGAAYVPFDGAWPDAWLDRVLTAAGCSIVVSDGAAPALAARLPLSLVLRVSDLLTGGAHLNPGIRVSADAIAYMNFTSGSTGTPKCVPIRHRSVSRLVFNASYAPLDRHAVLLQLATVSFDAATFEIWGALLHGGTCVLYPSRRLRLSELRRVAASRGITVIFLTTALFNSVLDEAPETLSDVRTILTGGEAHSLAHIREALRRYGRDRVVSVYGPTECTTFATYYPVGHLPPGLPALPIGRPIQNTRLYLVRDGKLCEPGETGEIWLAGPGLSPGYRGGTDTAAGRFLECEIDGVRERVYQTGDRGCFLPDDNVLFQGRVDDQVKVNGFRVELGEVARHIDRHPQVRQSFVTVTEIPGAGKKLLAFIIPGGSCAPQAIRSYLAERLPAYMIPAAIHLCSAFPLTATGKVDRNALLLTHEPPDGAT